MAFINWSESESQKKHLPLKKEVDALQRGEYVISFDSLVDLYTYFKKKILAPLE
jgi:hypothetical protein